MYLVNCHRNGIMGGVGGYYGDAWSLSRVGVTSIAGGFAAKSSGGNFNQGVKVAFVTSMMRLGFDEMRTHTNNSSLDGTGKHVYDTNGNLMTYGVRDRIYAPGYSNSDNNWFSSLGSNIHEGAKTNDAFNMVSKVHDFGNNWQYVAGNYLSKSEFYNSAANVWSIFTMPVAATYTLGAFATGAPSAALLVAMEK